MKSYKNNSINEKNKEKEDININNNINNNININNFQNIQISKEPQEYPTPEPKNNYRKKIPKTKLSQIINIKYEEISYELYLLLKEDNIIKIELIPKDGQIPHSYNCSLDEKKLYDLNPIFAEVKDAEKTYNKIINLFKKERATIIQDKENDIFYLKLSITIIDEDKEIYIKLDKNENIQLCTVNYLLREVGLLKNNLNENELKKVVEKEVKNLESIKENNKDYINIINQISIKEREINENENEDNKRKNEIEIINNKILDKISRIIIDKNEEFIELKNRINIIEEEFNSLNNKNL